MPELPEVETSRQGIIPHLEGRRVINLTVRAPRLRWPIPPELAAELPGQRIMSVTRRGKYLLLSAQTGTIILHLGMSGCLRILPVGTPPKLHDHVDLELEQGKILRFSDPRRFGALLWTTQDPKLHPLLAKLGPEPLNDEFSGEYLFSQSRGRKTAIKLLIMNSQVVVGVGNIYANEALFSAGIRPQRPCGKVSLVEYKRLAKAIKNTLTKAIKAGGTTLRDFASTDGKPGYFRHELQVYAREGENCLRCHTPLKTSRLGQRATVYCSSCQS